MNKFDMMSKDALSRVEEIMNATKLNDSFTEKKKRRNRKTVFSGF